jgi:CheY-like chemotaxis protein
VRLCDTGMGIAPGMQKQVFELFAQVERTPDRPQGGLGLGLALVKTLVELHGGMVWCRSEGLGRGSTFTVSLPCLSQAEARVERRHSSREFSPAPNRRKVLVVDDNADAADMLSLLLETNGHEVAVAHDGEAALAAALAMHPDVCLLDIGLPDMDGNELARRLRARPETARAVLIAVTGYGQEQDRRGSLTKPASTITSSNPWTRPGWRRFSTRWPVCTCSDECETDGNQQHTGGLVYLVAAQPSLGALSIAEQAVCPSSLVSISMPLADHVLWRVPTRPEVQ